jgi:hypothetical protein
VGSSFWAVLKIGGGAPDIFWATPTKFYFYFWNPQLKPSQLAPLLGELITVGGLGAWSQICMECPHVGRGGVFRQTTSK